MWVLIFAIVNLNTFYNYIKTFQLQRNNKIIKKHGD